MNHANVSLLFLSYCLLLSFYFENPVPLEDSLFPILSSALVCKAFMFELLSFCQDVTKGFAQTWSKDEEEGEEDIEEEEEEEDNDTSAETEGPSSSLDESTEKQAEEAQSAVSPQRWITCLTCFL